MLTIPSLCILSIIFPIPSSSSRRPPGVYPQIHLLASDIGFPLSDDPEPASPRIRIEAFLECVCPDSQHALTVLPRIQDHYGSANVSVRIHTFAMSYHRYGFVSNQALRVVGHRFPDKKLDFMRQVYSHLDDFYTVSSANRAYSDMLSLLADDVHSVTGLSQAEFHQVVDDYRAEEIHALEYALRRGVSGTPWYFVNGVEIGGATYRLGVDEWKTLLDDVFVLGGYNKNHK